MEYGDVYSINSDTFNNAVVLSEPFEDKVVIAPLGKGGKLTFTTNNKPIKILYEFIQIVNVSSLNTKVTYVDADKILPVGSYLGMLKS